MEGFNNLQLHYLLSLLENNPLEDVISKVKDKIKEREENESKSTEALKSKLEKYLGKYVKITYETHETRYFRLDEVGVSKSQFNCREDLSLKSRFQVSMYTDTTIDDDEKVIQSYKIPVCVAVINKDTDLSIIQEITNEEFNSAIENIIANGRIQ